MLNSGSGPLLQPETGLTERHSSLQTHLVGLLVFIMESNFSTQSPVCLFFSVEHMVDITSPTQLQDPPSSRRSNVIHACPMLSHCPELE